MRILGVIFIFLPCVLAGLFLSENIKAKRDFWGKMLLFNNYLQSEIIYKSTDFFEVITNYDFPFLKNLINLKDDFSFNNISKILSCENFSKKEKETLTDYFFGIGKSDIENQVKHLSLYEKIFTDFKESYTRDYEEKSKVYKSVSFFWGAGISILLI